MFVMPLTGPCASSKGGTWPPGGAGQDTTARALINGATTDKTLHEQLKPVSLGIQGTARHEY